MHLLQKSRWCATKNTFLCSKIFIKWFHHEKHTSFDLQLFLLISLKFQGRSEFLFEKKHEKHSEFSDKTESQQLPLNKTVDVVLDSFDNLFCRRCLVHSTSGNLPLLVMFLMSVCATMFIRVWFIWWYMFIQVFDCRLHGCSQNLVFPVSNKSFHVLIKLLFCAAKY